jgi:hypothetical protein
VHDGGHQVGRLGVAVRGEGAGARDITLADRALEPRQGLGGQRGLGAAPDRGRRRGDVGGVVGDRPRQQTGRHQQAQRKAGHPPSWTTGLPAWIEGFAQLRPIQPGRTAPLYGIEDTLATVTPLLGFAAWTIMPLPMYMPTWLIGL